MDVGCVKNVVFDHVDSLLMPSSFEYWVRLMGTKLMINTISIHGPISVGPNQEDPNISRPEARQILTLVKRQSIVAVIAMFLNITSFLSSGGTEIGTNKMELNLNKHLPDRWIGRRGRVEWPPRSPDILFATVSFWIAKRLCLCKSSKKRIRIDSLRSRRDNWYLTPVGKLMIPLFVAVPYALNRKLLNLCKCC